MHSLLSAALGNAGRNLRAHAETVVENAPNF